MAMRIPGLVPLLVLVSCATAAPALAAHACDPSPSPPEVRVHVWDADITYDFNHTAAQIGGMAQNAGNLHSGSAWIVRGLTVARYMVKREVGTLRSRAPDGLGWCSRVAKLDVWVGYQDPFVVYVQSEFPPGTCQHRAVLEHEHTHVRINREALVSHLAEMRDALVAVATGDGYPLYTQDADSGPQKLADNASAALSAVNAVETADRDARHAQLDSEPSLERTKAMCPAW